MKLDNIRRYHVVVSHVIVMVVAVALTASAQIPRTISYQGVLTDAAGLPISDGVHKLVINVYDPQSGSLPIYTETQQTSTAKGLFNISIGAVTPIPPTITFNNQYDIGVSVDDNPEMTPRTHMASTPYALHAAVADKLSSGGVGGFVIPYAGSIDSAVAAFTVGNNGSGSAIHTSNGSVWFSGDIGSTPTFGAGKRMMWIPSKAALRAGWLLNCASCWNDTNIGDHSFAVGVDTKASATGSIAMGNSSVANRPNATAIGIEVQAVGSNATAIGTRDTASGDNSIVMGTDSKASGLRSTSIGFQGAATADYATSIGRANSASGTNSTAMGWGSRASGASSIAIGESTTASGISSTAIGNRTVASGNYSNAFGFVNTASGTNSTAMGTHANTNNHTGCFVIGDNSITTDVSSTVDNQFMTRFSGGYRFYSNPDLQIGVFVTPDGNAWGTICDSNRKERIVITDQEEVLRKISALKLGSWNYKAQTPSIRHYGPMAQEFFAAFGSDGVGTIGNDSTITTADIDGVMMIALKGLEARTSELHRQQAEVLALREQVAQMKEQMDRIEEMLKSTPTIRSVTR